MRTPHSFHYGRNRLFRNEESVFYEEVHRLRCIHLFMAATNEYDRNRQSF